MSAVMTQPQRRCLIDEVFASPFIELLGLAPRNPVVRSLILAQTGKLPGPEHETFEQLKDWVETTCDKRKHTLTQAPVRAAEGIAIDVEFSETEYGRADYSVPRSGSDEFVFQGDELMEIIQEAIDCGDGLNDVVESLAKVIHEDAWSRCDASMDNYGEYDYGDHDSNDSGDGAIDFSKSQIRDRLTAFLRDRHPEMLEELV